MIYYIINLKMLLPTIIVLSLKLKKRYEVLQIYSQMNPAPTICSSVSRTLTIIYTKQQ